MMRSDYDNTTGILITEKNPNISYGPRYTYDDQTYNLYLQTVMDPINRGGIKCPVYALVPTVPKRVLISSSLTTPTGVGGSTPYIGILFTPHNVETVGHVFIYWPSNGINSWTWWQTIPLTELLGGSYARARTVSGALSLSSASIASGLATLQGTVDAIAYQDIWNMNTTNPDQVLPFNQDNKSVVTNTPLSGGVMLLAQPFEEARLINIEGPTIGQSDMELEIYPIATTNLQSLTFNLTNFVYGSYKVELRLSVIVGALPLPGNVTFSLACQAITFNATTNSSNVVTLQTVSLATLPLGQTGTYFFIANTETFVNPGATPLIRLVLQCPNLPAGTNYAGELRLVRLEDYGSNFVRNGVFAVIKNPAPNGVISLSGVVNYEAIPNEVLSRDLKVTTDGGYMSPKDLLMAKHMLSTRGDPLFKMVYPLEQWKHLSNSGYFQISSSRENLKKYKASGFGTVGRLIQGAAPLLGMVPGMQGLSAGASAFGHIMEEIDEAMERPSRRKGVYYASGYPVTMRLDGVDTTVLTTQQDVETMLFTDDQLFFDEVIGEPGLEIDTTSPSNLTMDLRSLLTKHRDDLQPLLRAVSQQVDDLKHFSNWVCPTLMVLQWNARYFLETGQPLVDHAGRGSLLGKSIAFWKDAAEGIGMKTTQRGTYLVLLPPWLILPAIVGGGEVVYGEPVTVDEREMVCIPSSGQLPTNILAEVGGQVKAIQSYNIGANIEFQYETGMTKILVQSGEVSRSFVVENYQAAGTKNVGEYVVKWDDYEPADDEYSLSKGELESLAQGDSDPQFDVKVLNFFRGGSLNIGTISLAHFPVVASTSQTAIPVFVSATPIGTDIRPKYVRVWVIQGNDSIDFYVNQQVGPTSVNPSDETMETLIQVATALRVANAPDSMFVTFYTNKPFAGTSCGLAVMVAAQGGIRGPLYTGTLRWDGSFQGVDKLDRKWAYSKEINRPMIYVGEPLRTQLSVSKEDLLVGSWNPNIDDENSYDDKGVIKGRGTLSFQVSNMSQLYLAQMSAQLNRSHGFTEGMNDAASNTLRTKTMSTMSTKGIKTKQDDDWLDENVDRNTAITRRQYLDRIGRKDLYENGYDRKLLNEEIQRLRFKDNSIKKDQERRKWGKYNTDAIDAKLEELGYSKMDEYRAMRKKYPKAFQHNKESLSDLKGVVESVAKFFADMSSKNQFKNAPAKTSLKVAINKRAKRIDGTTTTTTTTTMDRVESKQKEPKGHEIIEEDFDDGDYV